MEYNHEQSMEKRMKVLSYALTLELLASLTLGYILDINDVENSRSLGKMNSSLSFAQKMNLLLDNETITSGEKSKLDAFMNMRNQFMHNKSAYSYFHAFNSTKGDLNRLLKIYPHILDKSKVQKVNKGNEELIDEIEIELEKCVEELYSDGINIITASKGGKAKKMIRDTIMKNHQDDYDRLNDIISG